MEWSWTTDEFGASHAGRIGVLLEDGSEPKPVLYDVGSGGSVVACDDWWVYDGTLGAPKASHARAMCACGWRSERTYPIDWSRTDSRAPRHGEEATMASRWREHIGDVEARAVPLPGDLEEILSGVLGGERLERLAEETPLAALRLARLLKGTAEWLEGHASHLARREEIDVRTVATALGVNEETAAAVLHRI